MMSNLKKRKPIKPDRTCIPVIFPSDYPYGDKVSEPISVYAQRIGVKQGTVRTQCDNGTLPIIQRKRGAKREVNLYALYLRAKYKAEEFIRQHEH
ncbi:DNA-binding protein [Arsenophonus nasoniae]|uniref:DNA-binding protein n=1 Tax=Arsenophonus nasoniae TaxID=638 RepID=A0AA95GIN9_9GAMM|nr:DNA-binding protein [Arsenophonus nasoniae]WGL95096.1 DNA-binding protein [Arsenophonus nasoniae]